MMFDDFYNDQYREPSTGDEVYAQLKEIVYKSIKEEFLVELEYLKRENTRLNDDLTKCRAEKSKLSEWKRQHEIALQDAIKQARRVPIKELLEDFHLFAWKAESKRIYLPKCDKCDADRKLHFKSPSGKELTEPCPYCGSYSIEYHPREMKLVRFYFDRGATPNTRSNPISRYYQPRFSDENDLVEVEPVHMGSDVNDPQTAFEKISSYYAVFIDRDRCQAYCDYLNNQNKDKRWNS